MDEKPDKFGERAVKFDEEPLLRPGKATVWLGLSTFSVSVGSSLQFGYGTGVLTAPLGFGYINDFYNASNYQRREDYIDSGTMTWLIAFTTSLYCVGGAFGALLGGKLADILGRKGALLLNNIFSIAAALMFGFCGAEFANSFELVMLARIVIGFMVGCSITIVPLYLAEIAPVNLRGAIGTCHQLAITIGILLSQAFGLFVLNKPDQWPILLALTGVFSAIEILTLPFCPESPRWLLINKNKPEKCRAALIRLRGDDDVDDEITEMKEEAYKESSVQKVGMWAVVTARDPTWKMPLIISVVLHAAQQFSGINAVMFYATYIFKQTGMSDEEVSYATVGLGGVNVFMTIVAVFVVERIGRRKLLLFPFGIMAIATALLTVSLNLQSSFDWMRWLSLVFIFMYIINFAIGPGPIPFVIVPELWAQGPRPAAMSLSVQVNWWCNFIVGLSFPFIQEGIGAYTFLVFMGFLIVSTIFIFFFIPETRNRTFEDISSSFGKKKEVNQNEYELQDQR
ncbi:solute carrier family 2, facilitated glucose transporter member 5-like isoform X2 [Patiria miniata]|uniref:Major facilitator superfamily (MFS) profile domain-containing protein n=1 Tax=Patiria miniata TaxID=46514 RepID=A0A913Z6X5_PATMI|nr:solute carrier family 2, facilitated glucose transporter member 5-like [Patiria miniata]XP_038075175.1 solute carrier family 2, facilitated glucose transporter member 5-like isoform X2 [Patiria miniata]